MYSAAAFALSAGRGASRFTGQSADPLPFPIHLHSEIEKAWTESDNSPIVATDSIKNMVYLFSKQSPHCLSPEKFALDLALHLVGYYVRIQSFSSGLLQALVELRVPSHELVSRQSIPSLGRLTHSFALPQAHLHKSHVEITQLKWSRIPVAGKPHKHSFVRNGDEKRLTSVQVDATAGKDKMTASVTSGIKDLLVLKTTESSFENYVFDEFTTLKRKLLASDQRRYSLSADPCADLRSLHSRRRPHLLHRCRLLLHHPHLLVFAYSFRHRQPWHRL